MDAYKGGGMGRRTLPRLLFLGFVLFLFILQLPSPVRAGQAGTVKRRSLVASTVLAAQDDVTFGTVSERYVTQLSAQEKQVYAALVAADLKKGQALWRPSVRFTIEEATAKDAQALRETQPILELFAAGERGLYAFRLDYMERTYWMFDCDIDVNWSYTPSGDGMALVEVESMTFTPISYYGTALSEDEAVQAALSEAALEVRSNRRNATRVQTVSAIASYLASRSSYGYAGAKAGHTPSGVLLSKYGRQGNCEGYARAFFCLCKRLSVPVIYVESKTHAFTYVQLENGAWYGVDPSWADAGASVDFRWVLYGTAFAREKDSTGAHVAYLSRYGARLSVMAISKDSYVWK